MARKKKKKKAFPLFTLVIIGLMLGAGVALFSLWQDKIAKDFAAEEPQSVVEEPQADIVEEPPQEEPQPEEPQPKEERQIPSPTPSPIPSQIPEAQPSRGEIVVEGYVDRVDYNKGILTFSQEIEDEQTIKVDPKIQVSADAQIELEGRNVKLQELAIGDYVTMVLDKKGQARAIQIFR